MIYFNIYKIELLEKKTDYITEISSSYMKKFID